jgi:hypothetical protein
MGTAHAMEDQPGHGFTRRDHCVCIWHEPGLTQVNQPSVIAHSNDHAHVIETLDAHLCPWSTPPLKRLEAAKRSAEDQRVVLSEPLLKVGQRPYRRQ